MSHSFATLHQIWNDQDGTRLEVGPDLDGLGLTEIRAVEPGGKIGQRITLTDEQLELTILALRQRRDRPLLFDTPEDP